MSENTITALVFIVALQAIMVLVSFAITNINPDAQVLNIGGTLINQYNTGTAANPSLGSQGIVTSLPTSEEAINTNTVNVFTDPFGSIKSWITGLPGINFIYSTIMAPYNLLKSAGLPGGFVFVVGSFWYVIVLFTFISFLWGRP